MESFASMPPDCGIHLEGVEKKHKVQLDEQLTANQRKTVCRISDYMFRVKPTTPVKHAPSPPAHEANKPTRKWIFLSSQLRETNILSVYIYLFDLQAKRMHECREPEGNSPQFKLHLESCSTAVVGQWERKFAVWQLTQLQVNSMVRFFFFFFLKSGNKPRKEKKKEGKKRSTPLHSR